MIHANPHTGDAQEGELIPAAYTLIFSTPADYVAWRDQHFPPSTQPQPAPVPEQVSLKQFRKALRRRGVPPESIIAWINANIADPVARAEAIEDIEYSNVVERSNPFLSAMAAALGYDAAWVDETMILAASLQ